MINKKKIINDPIYGFVSIENELIFDLIEHPYFQRLRRIKQLGLTNLVYPGANHTRFHHALGAMHLMTKAIQVLRSKGAEISEEEELAAKIAILLHDIGHGPFSHVMEHSIVQDVSHEEISIAFMNAMNREYGGKLDMAIEIFSDRYHKKFLHQLVSSQLDVDRLDYLTRDSFYTGVSEGIVGLDRIIEMLNVSDDELVIDEKGIYSIEKFIIARRLMYWQVYLHKTTIGADTALLNVIRRARELVSRGVELFLLPNVEYFIKQNPTGQELIASTKILDRFSSLDDLDIMVCIKNWQDHDDFVLSYLSKSIIQRRLPKVTLQNEDVSGENIEALRKEVVNRFDISYEDTSYLVSFGSLDNAAYYSSREKIMIKKKNGQLTDLATATDNYNFVTANNVVTKYFVCRPK